jgi:tetratricopeptide (TPR) repeat protein
VSSSTVGAASEAAGGRRGPAADRRPDLDARLEGCLGGRRGFALCASITAALAIAAYANTLGYGLVSDDSNILKSPLLHDPWNLRAVFEGGFWLRRLGLYRPLFDWSCLLNYRLNEILFGSGESGFGFHAVNILLHAAASVLFYAWLRTLKPPGFVVALAAWLFAVHPIHTEAVANVTGRSEPIAAMFGFAFLILHRRGSAIAAPLAYLAAVFSKESAIVFLPIAVLADAFLSFGERRRLVARYAGCAAITVVWWLLRAHALSRDAGMLVSFVENPLVAASVGERVLTAAVIQLEYAKLLALPIGLSTDYSFAQTSIVSSFDVSVLVSAIAAVAFAALAWLARRRAPAVSLAVCAYATSFSITSNLFFPIGSILAERFAYTPSAFACLLAAWAAWLLARAAGERTVLAVSAAILVALTILTCRRNRVWKDEITLFEDQARTAPRSAKAHFNLGVTLSKSGDPRGAIAELEESLRIYADYPMTHLVLANELLHVPDPERSLAEYREALRLAPHFTEAHVFLAHALLDLGRVEEASAEIAELRARDPACADLAQLEALLARAVASGARPKTDLDLARELSAARDYRGAVVCLTRAIEQRGMSGAQRKEVLELLSAAYAALGDTRRAEECRKAATSSSSDDTPSPRK